MSEQNQQPEVAAEEQQEAVLQIQRLEDVQMAHCLTSQCPNMLFPYARELISNLVNRGTFPALNLSPVNFDALFIDYMNKQQAAAEAEENQETQH